MNSEQPTDSGSQLAWFKSSHSNNEGGACIEIAATPHTVHVRDSKDKDGPQLTFTPETWASFIAFAATRP